LKQTPNESIWFARGSKWEALEAKIQRVQRYKDSPTARDRYLCLQNVESVRSGALSVTLCWLMKGRQR